MEATKVIKLGLLGDGGTGKTQICNVFSGVEFHFDGIISIGLDKFEKKITLKNNENIKLIFWDTAGNERFKSASIKGVRNVEGIILVFDFLKRKSFDNLDDWLDMIKEELNDPIIILFGNKADFDKYEWKITSEEVKICRKKWNCFF